MRHIFMIAALGLAFAPAAHAENYDMGGKLTIGVTVEVVEIGKNAVYIDELAEACARDPYHSELCALLITYSADDQSRQNEDTSFQNRSIKRIEQPSHKIF